MIPYAELHCLSNFTFLEGASHPEELVSTAAALGYNAIAITDRDGLYAAVRLHEASKEQGIQAIFGAEVTLDDGSILTLLARDAQGYQNLSQLLTAGRRARPKGQSAVDTPTLDAFSKGLIALSGGPRGGIARALIQGRPDEARTRAEALLARYGTGEVYLELTNHLLPFELTLNRATLELARRLDLPLVATSEARYATPDRKRLQDVLTCIRHLTSLPAAGTRLMPNAEYFLQPRDCILQRFQAVPGALKATQQIAERCQFKLAELNFSLPEFPVPPPHRSMLEYLEHLTFLYAASRFPEVNAKVVLQLRHELEVIGRHGLEGYFLIVWDIMKFCHDQGILAQGRGSAANSAVCFSLGITNVDPIAQQLLFERFLSEGRNEAPDIDLDIANDRREEVIQYVYQRYGRDHAGMVCEVICFRARSAVRDVGKALGLTLDQVDRIAKNIDRWHFRGQTSKTPTAESPEASRTEDPSSEPSPQVKAEAASDHVQAVQGSLAGEAGPEAESEPDPVRPSQDFQTESSPNPSERGQHLESPELDAHESRIATLLWELCQQIEGFPRHLGIHVGGMIICATPLGALVPIENATMEDRTVVQWDKDDVGALKMPKIDLLGLGMLSLIGEALELIYVHEGKVLDPARLSYDDPEVFRLISEADTVGVFQVESRAQMAVLPRLRPRRFYDLVVQVSLIRPGPIQGEMVHPYIRRRNGQEPVTYPHPSLQPILERTLGIPLFQEQGMKVAITAAGFSASEADQLRRAMSSKRSRSLMENLTQRLLEGMRQNGYDEDIASRVVSQIKAFASYGFPESHAASFALLVYVSAYLKRYHPLAFYSALLNNQPMGFYSPQSIVQEMLRKGIPVLPVDVCRSSWEWTIEREGIRAGLTSVRGLGDAHRERWEEARRGGAWRSIEDVCTRLSWPRLLLERLAAVGAFDSLGRDRREALWRVQGWRPRPGLAAPPAVEEDVTLRPMHLGEELALDLANVGHSVKAHPISLMRQTLDRWKVVLSRDLSRTRTDAPVRVAGMVTVRQRPPTAKGFTFLTLEDESGMINVIVRPDVYETYRVAVRRAMLLVIEGRLQRAQGVINIMAEKVAALDGRQTVALRSRDFH